MSKVRVKPSTNWEWKQLVPTGNETLSGTEQIIKHCIDLDQLPTKRKSTPLSIIGMMFIFQILKNKHTIFIVVLLFLTELAGLPNYDKLSKDEQELCSLIRVVPDSYLTYKKLLITENSKMGYLRLADARRLIKIDVNKTRVMYDFFFEHGYVNKPFDK